MAEGVALRRTGHARFRRTPRVVLFLLRVKRLKGAWKEQGHRKVEWLSPEDAAALVQEPKLAALVAVVSRQLKSLTAASAAEQRR
jgi:hypothetical protein